MVDGKIHLLQSRLIAATPHLNDWLFQSQFNFVDEKRLANLARLS
jgi:hypothetical protein